MRKKFLPLIEEPIDLFSIPDVKENIKKYARSQKFFYTCKACKRQVTIFRIYWNGTHLCKVCKRKETNIKRYGIDSPFKDKEKIKKAFLKSME